MTRRDPRRRHGLLHAAALADWRSADGEGGGGEVGDKVGYLRGWKHGTNKKRPASDDPGLTAVTPSRD